MPATPSQLALAVELRDFPELGSFVPGPNEPVLAAARQLLEQPGQMLVWSPAACGKSLLLQGISRLATEQGQAAFYLPFSRFAHARPALFDGLDQLDLVCLDELDAIAGSREAESAVVELISRLRAAEVSLLLASRQAPEHLPLVLEDLRSRLNWGACYGMQDLADEDKSELLRRRARARGLTLAPDAAAYLMRRQSRDMGSLIEVLDRLDRASLAAKRALTIPFIRQTLDDGR